jgi:hypothetical protein
MESTIDRFAVGFSYERNLGYMDGFMLNDYNSLYLTIGYRFISH